MTKSPPIVLQLQELAVNSDHNVSDLLRKALLVATKLGLKDFEQWISSELNGYPEINQVPDYRRITGDVKAYNSVQGRYIPFVVDNVEIMNSLQTVILHESIESLQHAVKESETKEGLISYSFPLEIQHMLMSWQNTRLQVIPTQLIGVNQVVAVIQKVRTRILEWSLSLEAANILGENLTFSLEEKRMARSNQSISITNFQGILGDIHGDSVSQTMSMHITPGSFDSLSKYLESKGLSADDITELEQAVRQDPEQPVKGKFGDQVSKWTGKMVSKAASGSWDVGVSAAGDLLSSALMKFYGF